jgi:hypothetical protein
METESDADRVAGNNLVLEDIDTQITAIEQIFSKIEFLENEKIRLSAACENLTADETRTLADDAAESLIVKKLIEIRARKDVQFARLISTQNKIKELTANLADQAGEIRRAFRVVVGQLFLVRQTAATETLRELFKSDWIVLKDGTRYEMKFLAKHTKAMKELRDFDVKVCHEIADPEQEILVLRQQPRLWLSALREFVASESKLVLRTASAKPQPIEQQPAREMATV